MSNRLDSSSSNRMDLSPSIGSQPIRCPSISTSPNERGFYFDFKDSNGSKFSPLGMPSPISMYQHIRYPASSPSASPSDNRGGCAYSYSPPSSPSFQWSSSLPYTNYMLGAGVSANANVNAAAGAGLQKRISDNGGCTGIDCMCTRHHHRRSSMAVKFGDDISWESSQQDMTTEAPFATDEMLRRGPSLRRPPSPISEGILKGDFSF